MKEMYSKGVSWSEVKELVFQSLNTYLEEKRDNYRALIKDKEGIEDWLQKGAKEARTISALFISEVRSCLGVN